MPSRARLLVVDDEPDMLEFIERVMRRRFSVTRCSSADEAIAALEVADYEAVITDQKMPRMSGLEMLAKIADEKPRMVRVLLSGYTELPDIEGAIERAVVHAYVLKPIDSSRLMQALDHAYRVRDGAPFERMQ